MDLVLIKALLEQLENIIADFDERELDDTDWENLNRQELICLFNSLSLAKRKTEDKPKTNFDVLMSCQTPEQFERLYKQTFGCGCMQTMARKNGMDIEVWKKRCLTEYRGEDGCHQCMLEFWKQQYKE